MDEEKIKKLIEKIINESEKIQSVTKEVNEFEELEEYYFTYPEEKYAWSVSKDSMGEYSIFYYPSRHIKSNFLRFSKTELGTTSMINLKSLFEILRGKLYGFDDVLSDILS